MDIVLVEVVNEGFSSFFFFFFFTFLSLSFSFLSLSWLFMISLGPKKGMFAQLWGERVFLLL